MKEIKYFDSKSGTYKSVNELHNKYKGSKKDSVDKPYKDDELEKLPIRKNKRKMYYENVSDEGDLQLLPHGKVKILEDTQVKPFDLNTGLKSYQVDGKVIKRLLKKVKSDNAIRELSGEK